MSHVRVLGSIQCLLLCTIATLQVPWKELIRSGLFVVLSISTAVAPALLISLFSYEFPSLIGECACAAFYTDRYVCSSLEMTLVVSFVAFSAAASSTNKRQPLPCCSRLRCGCGSKADAGR